MYDLKQLREKKKKRINVFWWRFLSDESHGDVLLQPHRSSLVNGKPKKDTEKAHHVVFLIQAREVRIVESELEYNFSVECMQRFHVTTIFLLNRKSFLKSGVY